MEINQNRLIELFLELVRIDGVSLKERHVTDYIIENFNTWEIPFEEDGAATKINGSSGNLIARKISNHRTDDSVLLMAHQDTVISTANLNSVVENGIIKTDGTTILGGDNRAGIAIILYVLEEIYQRNLKHRNFEVVFSVAEELGMLGALALDFSRIVSGQGYILDCSRKAGCYVATTPTAIDFTANFIGHAAHSGVAPENGVNALSMAVDLIHKIPVGRIDDQTVANIGTIRGGTAINVVPEKVTIVGEIRSFDDRKIHDIRHHIETDAECIAAKYGGRIDTSFKTGFKGFKLEQHQPVVKRLEDELNKMGIPPDPLKYYGGSDANVLNNNGVAAVNIGIGVNNPHSNNEYVVIKDLVAAAELLTRLIDLEES